MVEHTPMDQNHCTRVRYSCFGKSRGKVKGWTSLPSFLIEDGDPLGWRQSREMKYKVSALPWWLLLVVYDAFYLWSYIYKDRVKWISLLTHKCCKMLGQKKMSPYFFLKKIWNGVTPKKEFFKESIVSRILEGWIDPRKILINKSLLLPLENIFFKIYLCIYAYKCSPSMQSWRGNHIP